MKTKILIFLILNSSLLILNSKAQMIWNQACTFAGTSTSYIAVPNSASLNITGDFSIDMWINPVNATSGPQILLQKRAVGNNVGYTLYLSSGKVSIRTNSSTRLIGKTVIPNNQWTHVAGTYSMATNLFRVFVNGVLDTSSVFAGAAPLTNTDSLLIGVGNNGPFNGMMDEIRIWNGTLSTSGILELMRTSLGTNSGFYTGLVASYSFQNTNGSGTLFNVSDNCGNGNNGVNRGVTGFTMFNEPGKTIFLNQSVTLDGTGDYLSGPDMSVVSPVSGITLEAWVYPKSFNATTSVLSTIIHKGNSSGTVTDYRIGIQKRSLNFFINETNIFGLSTSGEFFPLNQWTHFAITYSGGDGFIKFLLNGKLRWDDTNFVGNIHDNTDSIYIGGTPALQCFDGYIDEVKITSAVKSSSDIVTNAFTSVNELNDPTSANVVYNFDGGLVSNSNTGPRLNFRGNSKFIDSPVSPLTFSLANSFGKSFYFSEEITGSTLRIPAAGTSGFMISDTIDVPLSETISDVNVYVGLNHTDEDNLIISLISPSGASVILYNTSSLIAGDDIATIYDDQANTTIASNTYTGWSPSIKPQNNINSVFNGTDTKGKWKLRIQDAAVNDTGRLFQWGIQFNNHTKRKAVLSLTSLIQGFYDPATNIQVDDTMQVYARRSFVPYAIMDSSKAVLDSAGRADFVFNNITEGEPVFIQLKHRNSLETWSKKPSSGTFALLFAIQFTAFTSFLEYDFTNTSTKAFGNNMTLVDTGPNKFAIYSGDVNQDGFINLSDVISINNDAGTFTSGYRVTDINGDNLSDLADVILANNNSTNFIGVVRP